VLPHSSAGPRAGDFLKQGRIDERAGRTGPARQAYEEAVRLAEAAGDGPVVAQALRQLSILAHQNGEGAAAAELCRRSHAVADALGDRLLAAQALNTLASFLFEGGEIELAHATYQKALGLGAGDAGLRARIEQNLGILANIQGDHAEALAHYGRALDACLQLGDDRGCALAYHNLGMVSADQGQWDEASRFFARSLALAERLGDVHLQGLCLLNRAEVHIARQRYDSARTDVEAALAIFDRVDARLDKADAYRMLGMVFRETGRPAIAESRLRDSRELAAATGSVLSEAEACRELARLYQELGRNQDALSMLNASYRLFGRLNARTELVDVGARVARLEGAYLRVVKEWGQSIESADSYTHGHCERVAQYAIAVAVALGLDAAAQQTIQLGAYLHDVGKVRIPHELLNKPGRLTAEEFEVIQMHPVWGIELLAEVEFPWDLKSIIRWHHERYDGTGYPDRLRGDEIPVAAQVICIVDVYDALTTARSYKPGMAPAEALERMAESRHWWRPDVYDAFMRSVGAATGSSTAVA
jgi:putative nucleotidyltransferase with HDIG domain